jgi:YVTN family beta-propeller protein
MTHWIKPRAALVLTGLFLLFQGSLSPVTGKELGPQAVAASPDGLRLYVSNTADSSIAVIDAATFLPVGSVKIPSRIRDYSLLPGLVVSPDSTRLYVLHPLDYQVSPALGSVLVVDTATTQILATIKVGMMPSALAISPNGQRVCVTNSKSGTVSVIDTAADNMIASVKVGNNPRGVAVTPDGRHVYVANGGVEDSDFMPRRDTMTVIDTGTDEVIATVQVRGHPYQVAVSPDGKWVYVSSGCACNQEVNVIDTGSNQVVATLPFRMTKYTFPFGLTTGAGGNRLFVSTANSGNTLHVLDTATLQAKSVKLPDTLTQMALSPDGARLYLTHAHSRTVSALDTRTHELKTVLKLADSPAASN